MRYGLDETGISEPTSGSLPTPLAELCGRLERTGEKQSDRLVRLSLQLVEATIRYTAAVLIAAYDRLDVRDNDFDSFLKRLSNRPPMFGDWRGCTTRFCDLARDDRYFASLPGSVREVVRSLETSQLPEEVSQYLKVVDTISAPNGDLSGAAKLNGDPKSRGRDHRVSAEDFTKFVHQQRNDGFHDGASWYLENEEHLGPPLAKAVMAFVGALDWLAEYPLFLARSVKPAGRDMWRYSGDLLVGESPRTGAILVSNDNLLRGRVVFDPSGAALLMAPLVVARECENNRCKGERLFFYSAWKGNKRGVPSYAHLFCGGRVDGNPEDVDDWQALQRPSQKPAEPASGLYGGCRLPAGPLYAGRPFTLRVHLVNHYRETLEDLHVEVPVPQGVELSGDGDARRVVKEIKHTGREVIPFELVKHSPGTIVFEEPRVSYSLGSNRPPEYSLSRPEPGEAAETMERAVVFQQVPKLVGRDREVELLWQRFVETRDGLPRVVVLEGASGVGKSEIWRWFRDEKLPRKGVTVVEVDCDDKLLVDEMGPLTGLLRNYLWQQDWQRIAAPLARHLKREVDPLAPPRLSKDELLAVLGEVLDMDLSVFELNDEMGTNTPSDSPAMRKERLARSIELLFKAICRSAPATAFFIDNIHLMHADSWEWFERITQFLRRESVFLVVAKRPTHLQSSVGTNLRPVSQIRETLRGLQADWLNLGPLTTEETIELFDEHLPDNQIVLEKKKEIAEVVDGDPIWLFTLINRLHLSGEIAWTEEQGWTDTGSHPAQQGRNSLEELIEDEVISLDAESQELLQRAAVVGRRFQMWQLGLADGDFEKLFSESTDRHRLVLDSGELVNGHRVIEFIHTKVHAVVYRLVESARRKALHAEVARVIEDNNGSLSDLLYHWERAGDLEKTLEYSVKRSTEYFESTSYGDAAHDLARAIQLIQDHGRLRDEHQLLHLQRRLARCYWIRGKRKQAIELDRQNIDLAEQLRLGEDRAKLIGTYIHNLIELQDISKARIALGRYNTALQTDDERPRALLLCGMIEAQERGLDAARQTLSQCIDLARKRSDAYMISEAQRQLGMVHQLGGEFTEARERFEAALENSGLLEGRARAYGQARAFFHIACLCDQLGDAACAVEELDESLRLWEKLDDPQGLSKCLWSRARVALLMGETERAEDFAERAFSLARRVGLDSEAVRSRELQAEIRLVLGDIEACLEICRKARDRCRKHDLPAVFDLRLALVAVKALLAGGRFDEAAQAIEAIRIDGTEDAALCIEYAIAVSRSRRAIGMASDGSDVLEAIEESPQADLDHALMMRAELELAKIELFAGRYEAALTRLDPVVRETAKGQLNLIRARADLLVGSAHFRAKDYPQARLFLGSALERARRVGDVVGIVTALEELGQLAGAEERFAEARSRLEEALALRHLLGDIGAIDMIEMLLTEFGARRSEIDELTARISIGAERREADDGATKRDSRS